MELIRTEIYQKKSQMNSISSRFWGRFSKVTFKVHLNLEQKRYSNLVFFTQHQMGRDSLYCRRSSFYLSGVSFGYLLHLSIFCAPSFLLSRPIPVSNENQAKSLQRSSANVKSGYSKFQIDLSVSMCV